MRLRERLVASVTDIRARGQRLLELNRELLAAELKEKGRRVGAAVALFVGAGLFALYAIGFALATIAVALALVLPLWLALLIVTAVLLLLVAIMALVGRDMMRKAQTPPAEAARAEATKTVELVKANVRDTAVGVRAKVTPDRAGGGGTTSPVPPPEPPGTTAQAGPPPGTSTDAEARDS